MPRKATATFVLTVLASADQSTSLINPETASNRPVTSAAQLKDPIALKIKFRAPSNKSPNVAPISDQSTPSTKPPIRLPNASPSSAHGKFSIAV